jgi:RsiW-degrading membrane proteinase PrsW (M82 family)
MIELAANIGVALISGAAWFGLLVMIDSHHREKLAARKLFISLLLGFASIPLVILLYKLAPDLTSGIQSEHGQDFVGNVLVVGPVEEFAKFFVFFLVMVVGKPVQEPLDSMLHAAAVALAFSLTENVQYGLSYGIDVTVLRAVVSTPGHLTFACIWGFAYAVLIHDNPKHRPRDFVILFFSIYPAALLHGMSNFFLGLVGEWALLSDMVQFAAAFGLLAWIQRSSPFRPFRLSEASKAVRRIDASLSSNGNSFPLHLRAALARAALGDFARARRHADICLRLRKGDAFGLALSGAIYVLKGETARGEQALRSSYPSLTERQKQTIGRLSRHVASSRRTDNAYNEFQLSMWIKNPSKSSRRAAPIFRNEARSSHFPIG